MRWPSLSQGSFCLSQLHIFRQTCKLPRILAHFAVSNADGAQPVSTSRSYHSCLLDNHSWIQLTCTLRSFRPSFTMKLAKISYLKRRRHLSLCKSSRCLLLSWPLVCFVYLWTCQTSLWLFSDRMQDYLGFLAAASRDHDRSSTTRLDWRPYRAAIKRDHFSLPSVASKNSISKVILIVNSNEVLERCNFLLLISCWLRIILRCLCCFLRWSPLRKTLVNLTKVYLPF